ncbi:hypothetical protein J0H58_26125 [bacterium]|nr:hypothetical protein [bacterium]
MPHPPRLISHDNQTLTIAEWAKRTRIPVNTIRSRIDKQGWSVAETLSTPIVAKFNPRRAKSIPAPRPCPPLKIHQSSGQAYCRWRAHSQEHWRYFGDAGSKEAAEGYRRFQMEWAARGAAPPPQGGQLFVCELAERYLEHVDRYYVKDGNPLRSGRGCSEGITCLPTQSSSRESRTDDVAGADSAGLAAGFIKPAAKPARH